ncbi:fructose-bisphosphate aldolase class I [Myxococcota bacterium]|nr:fructose-bisphosphate aldolase class I [Myxococcota bacterium]MCZ7618747.1 fructose-bisphosphate aldolase class I [Myxococcota bacterium]
MSHHSGPELEATARALVAAGKGILAADESSGTIKKRFDSIQTESTEDNRRSYREMLFTTPGCEEFISGVILFDETIRQKGSDGIPLPQVLEKKGIIPGIKVDKGVQKLPFSDDEKITEGLDGLRARLVEYRSLGARFAKWRAVIEVTDSKPSDACLQTNADALARYAALCVDEGLVPIVEPEILMDGTHTIERSFAATERTLHFVFGSLFEQRVPLEQILLKPNMVLSGYSCPQQASVQQVAEQTIRCFRRVVPAAVPGIVFLSGGQSDEAATAHLDAMNRIGGLPWEISFSYGRALQAPALKAWGGRPDRLEAGQRAFYHRAKLNGAARHGRYDPAMEKAA